MILATLAVPALVAAHAPAALASGPLLSGYGGPGAGAQAIIGATLLNGPKGGAGGGGSGGSSASNSSSSSSSSSAGGPSAFSSSNSAGTSRGANAGAPPARDGSGGGGVARRAAGGEASAGDPSAHSRFSRPKAPAASLSAEASWFTGGDLLALVLAAGVLVLVAVATVRLAGTHDG